MAICWSIPRPILKSKRYTWLLKLTFIILSIAAIPNICHWCCVVTAFKRTGLRCSFCKGCYVIICIGHAIHVYKQIHAEIEKTLLEVSCTENGQLQNLHGYTHTPTPDNYTNNETQKMRWFQVLAEHLKGTYHEAVKQKTETVQLKCTPPPPTIIQPCITAVIHLHWSLQSRLFEDQSRTLRILRFSSGPSGK